ncbi:FecR domain-containing protein [Pedobacter sp. MC2016-14]|uniref:FecR family protein n=1 Tax=Pedobacter sp. MC2016-14 TaxID=2897327 RepID=UPI001E39F065|nr:FecR family protein [Pedobacter sp. MC2016-14]MCD0486987.1 FecR domain-containing protein [Pedobacter sp. MC2016-14]
MQKNKAKELLLKYKTGNCTPEEMAWLESWYLKLNTDERLQPSERELREVENEMMLALGLSSPKVYKLWTKVAAAAVVLVFLSISFYYMRSELRQDSIVQVAPIIRPGGNKAVLILSNGKRIDLESAKSGELAKSGNVIIKKSKDGQVVYDLSSAGAGYDPGNQVNAIETPRSGTYQIKLPDGSSVWLNAASRLIFPTGFTGKDRTVRLSGEAYFEIAKDKSKPFKVISGGQTIEVLGTHFNVNHYKDEPDIKTTLLEGSVKLTSRTSMGQRPGSTILAPGEQAQLQPSGDIKVVNIDTEQVIAWKNGVFNFKRADLKTVMRQISRWYDVEVEYQEEMPEISFTGKIYRNVNLQEALKSISYLDVNFSVKGKKVFVKPAP